MLSRLGQCLHFMRTRLPSALPNACALCGADGLEAICAGCRAQFLQLQPARCACCGVPLAHEEHGSTLDCGECLKKRPAFDATIVGTDYAAPFDQLVLGLKFNHRLELAPLLAAILRDTLLRLPAFALPTGLTAVPLGAHRLAERGFNQALEVARPLSHSLGIPLHPRLLRRRRDTRAQSLLPQDQRRANMRRAFALDDHAGLTMHGMHMGVIDDVMTTGETLNEVAATLKRAGAKRVTNFVFARTPPR